MHKLQSVDFQKPKNDIQDTIFDMPSGILRLSNPVLTEHTLHKTMTYDNIRSTRTKTIHFLLKKSVLNRIGNTIMYREKYQKIGTFPNQLKYYVKRHSKTL